MYEIEQVDEVFNVVDSINQKVMKVFYNQTDADTYLRYLTNGVTNIPQDKQFLAE